MYWFCSVCTREVEEYSDRLLGQRPQNGVRRQRTWLEWGRRRTLCGAQVNARKTRGGYSMPGGSVRG